MRATGAAPLVLLLAASAAAENVHVQIECGNPPRTAPTAHVARVEGLVVGETIFADGLAIPKHGRLAGLVIDGRPLTLPSGSIRDGFLETADLGRVFLSLSTADPGYFLVLRPEQLGQLDGLPAGRAPRRPSGGAPGGSSVPLVDRGGIRQ